MQGGLDFRSPLPVKETEREKFQRVARERKEADAFLRYRMKVIADTYSVPIHELYYKKVVLKAMTKYRKELLAYQLKHGLKPLDAEHVVQVDPTGLLTCASQILGDELPQNFYRTTKLVAWRMYRSHPHPEEEFPHGRRRPHFKRPQILPEDQAPNYNDFINKIADVMLRTTAKEAQLKGRSATGSFLLLTPFEKKQYKHDLKMSVLKESPEHKYKSREFRMAPAQRITEELAERKMEERSQAWFKGRGTPSDQPPSRSRPDSVSQPSDASHTEPSDQEDNTSQDTPGLRDDTTTGAES